MDPKYILFDLDGTLTDPKEGITKSVAYALAQYGIIEDPDNLTRFIGPPLHIAMHNWYGFDEEKAFEAVGHYRVYFSQKGIFENAVFDGVPEMLEKLKAKGKIISLCTSKPEIYARQILEHFDLMKYFDHVCGATMDGKRSLKTDVVTYAVETCGITDKSEAVMVGDRHHDIEGGKANGLPTVGVLFGYGSREELAEAGADVIAETIPELYDILKGE
ncbi:MAG: HAD family hydrolase [Clostridia bacterium]|nr:HAD family hydrolase [Clostridia bacterium]